MAIIRNIGGFNFQSVYEIGEGQDFHFLAGSRISIEKWEMRPGKTDFDYTVNSRQTIGGKPVALATTEEERRDEFFEHRVASRQVVPISLGNMGNLRDGKMPDVQFTYGEAVPQVFHSTVESTPVAWSIRFRRARHSGMASNRVTRPSGAKAARTGEQASLRAKSAARLDAVTSMTFLRVFVRLSDIAHYRALSEAVGKGDIIGRKPGMVEQIISELRR